METIESRKQKIITISEIIGLNPTWCLAIADVESSMGINQLSPTGAKGVYQLTNIAFKDLRQDMERKNDDTIDILCGLAFLYLLKRRWGSETEATLHYCDPAVKTDYLEKMKKAMAKFEKELEGTHQSGNS